MPDTDKMSGFVFSEHSTRIVQWIVFTTLCQMIDIFGIVTNIINIACFIKQGFKESVNVSLMGLAVADLGCLTTLIWTNICYTPAFIDLDLPFEAIELQYLTAAMPHTTFVRVSAWITALITLERCLCITAPLKVRHLVTPKSVSVIITCIFILLILSVTPLYVVNKLDMKFSPTRNKTLLGLVGSSNREDVETISFGINNVLVPFGAFFVVTVCTITLVIEIKRRTQWRKKSAVSIQAERISNRNTKVARMVVAISTLFIVCFIPLSIVFTGMVLEPELSLYGRYRNTLILVGGLSFVFESLNSSVNIFIYYQMSTKYREIFHQLFLRTGRKQSIY